MIALPSMTYVKKYDIVLYTLEDLEQDRATARQLGL